MKYKLVRCDACDRQVKVNLDQKEYWTRCRCGTLVLARPLPQGQDAKKKYERC